MAESSVIFAKDATEYDTWQCVGFWTKCPPRRTIFSTSTENNIYRLDRVNQAVKSAEAKEVYESRDRTSAFITPRWTATTALKFDQKKQYYVYETTLVTANARCASVDSHHLLVCGPPMVLYVERRPDGSCEVVGAYLFRSFLANDDLAQRSAIQFWRSLGRPSNLHLAGELCRQALVRIVELNKLKNPLDAAFYWSDLLRTMLVICTDKGRVKVGASTLSGVRCYKEGRQERKKQQKMDSVGDFKMTEYGIMDQKPSLAETLLNNYSKQGSVCVQFANIDLCLRVDGNASG